MPAQPHHQGLTASIITIVRLLFLWLRSSSIRPHHHPYLFRSAATTHVQDKTWSKKKLGWIPSTDPTRPAPKLNPISTQENKRTRPAPNPPEIHKQKKTGLSHKPECYNNPTRTYQATTIDPCYSLEIDLLLQGFVFGCNSHIWCLIQVFLEPLSSWRRELRTIILYRSLRSLWFSVSNFF